MILEKYFDLDDRKEQSKIESVFLEKRTKQMEKKYYMKTSNKRNLA